MMNELLIPEAAIRDTHSTEMARVWIAEHGLHCSLRIGTYAKTEGVEEEIAWGIILADMARHVGSGLAETENASDERGLVARIRDSFLAELTKPTSKMRGGFAQSE